MEKSIHYGDLGGEILATVIILIVDDLSEGKFVLSVVIEYGCAHVHTYKGYVYRERVLDKLTA